MNVAITGISISADCRRNLSGSFHPQAAASRWPASAPPFRKRASWWRCAPGHAVRVNTVPLNFHHSYRSASRVDVSAQPPISPGLQFLPVVKGCGQPRIQVRIMRKGHTIGESVPVVMFMLYMSWLFILFPIKLKALPETAAEGDTGADIYDVLASPVIKALEGDNLYYNSWSRYARSQCRESGMDCTHILQDESPAAVVAQE